MDIYKGRRDREKGGNGKEGIERWESDMVGGNDECTVQSVNGRKGRA